MRLPRFILVVACGSIGYGTIGCSRLAPPTTVVAPVVAEQPVMVVPCEPCPPDGSLFAPPAMVVPGAVVPGGIPAFPEATVVAPPAQPAAVPPASGPLGLGALGDWGTPSDWVGIGGGEPAAMLANPVRVPVTNHEYAWDQITQVVANYFPIAREDRVRIEGDMWAEGRIETPYRIGATVFEPWRGDSVGSFNLWQSTLQTIRRRALVRVIPEGNNYAIEVNVEKELEDLPQPEQATAGEATLRTDSSLPSTLRPEVSRVRASQLWIPLGRDVALEQKMLAEIQSRLGVAPEVRTTVGGY